MKDFWREVTVVFCVVLLRPDCATADIPTYNTSLTCLRGIDRNVDIDIDCYDKDPDSRVYVNRIIHGLTPKSSGCNVVAPRATCCPDPADPARDCVFSSSAEKLEALRKKCNGLRSCFTTMNRVSVDDGQCPARDGLTYGRYSDFVRVEFLCPNDELMSDVCDNNVTITGNSVFLETNFLDDNRNHNNKTCSCVIATTCEHQLSFDILELSLAKDASGNCTERVVLTEGDDTTEMAAFNCSYDPLQEPGGASEDGGKRSVLVSRSSVVGFDLHLLSNNTGQVLIHVTATKGAPVEVVCGQPASQELLLQTSCQPAPVENRVTSKYNTTKEACLQGTDVNHDFLISCLQYSHAGLIFVDRILHGVTPEVMGCNVMGPKNSCCPGYDPDRDCLFSTEEGLARLRKLCDGTLECFPTLSKQRVRDECPPRHGMGGTLTYDSKSYFAFVEYTCIDVRQMNDVCHVGTILRDTQVFLDSNVYKNNQDHVNSRCTCLISAPCGQRLLFHVIDLLLKSTETGNGSTTSCMEKVVVVDMVNGSVSASLDCDSNQTVPVHRGEGSEPWFESQSNMVKFQLQLGDQHEGKLLLRVTASGSSEVDVRCGRTTELGVWNQHRCKNDSSSSTSATADTASPTSAPSTPVNTASPSPTPSTTTTRKPGEDNEDDGSSITTGIAVGVAVVAFLVLFIIVCLLLIVWRGRKRALDIDNTEDDYDNNAVHYVAGEEPPLAFASITGMPSSNTTADNNALYDHPGTASDNEKHYYDNLVVQDAEKRDLSQEMGFSGDWQGEEAGAVGGAVCPPYEYDNVVNSRLQEKEMNE